MEGKSTSAKCIVCDNIADGAHKCNQCKQIVHQICGNGIGEEGYGQEVVCFKCSKSETKISKAKGKLQLNKTIFSCLYSRICYLFTA